MIILSGLFSLIREERGVQPAGAHYSGREEEAGGWCRGRFIDFLLVMRHALDGKINYSRFCSNNCKTVTAILKYLKLKFSIAL